METVHWTRGAATMTTTAAMERTNSIAAAAMKGNFAVHRRGNVSFNQKYATVIWIASARAPMNMDAPPTPVYGVT